MKNNDKLFSEYEVTEKSYKTNLYPETPEMLVKGEKESVLMPLDFGSVYVVRFEGLPGEARAVLCIDLDTLECETRATLPFGEACDFLCTPLKEGEYLVINTDAPFHIYKNPVILENDTDDLWFYPPEAGHLNGGEGSWGDWQWTSDELFENVYEILMKKYPDYIKREIIGYDESGKYEMRAYIFEPREVEKTLFITSGVHGNEFDGYLSLARFLEILCENYEGHEGLEYVRHHVKLVVVPIVNVWSTHEKKWRFNCREVDLNRDFADLSQAESQNVAKFMKKHRDEIYAVLDLHTSAARFPALFYQFNIQAENSAVCRKVINHIYHRLLEKGYEKEADMSFIPGRYIKNTCFLQGYAYNELGLPNIVVEHNEERWYPYHSAEAFSHAVECYGNFIIQTSLAKQ